MTNRIRAALGVLVLGIVLALGMSAPAVAGGGGGLQQCMDQAINHNGEPPTCTKENGEWVASWDDDQGMSTGSGFPAIFGVLFVLVILGGIGLTVWRVSTARSLARGSGMDPGLATQMTLLSDDGLDATYLAASLRKPTPEQQPTSPAPPPAEPTAARSAADRLAELKALQDQGLITQAEYDTRRTAIIDGV